MDFPPDSSPLRPRPRTRRPYTIAVAAIIAVVMVAMGVFLNGQAPGTKSTGPTKTPTEQQAAASQPAPASALPPQTSAPAQAAMPTAEEFAKGAGRTAAPPAGLQQDPGAKPPQVAMPLPLDFLNKLLDASGKNATFQLPDGRAAAGAVDLIRHDAQGVLLVQGKLTQPQAGFYFFQRQTVPGKAGAIVGVVHFETGDTAFRVDPVGPNGAPMLVKHPVNDVICRGMGKVPPEVENAAETQNAPQTHPTDIPIPADQNGVIPLQSLPGATGVVYLDFDGEPGPFAGWDNPKTAAPSGATTAQIKEVWQRVAEDFQPFNVNVTTDRRVFDNAREGRRQHVVITPSFSGGGVAFIGSFNWNGDTVCWSGYTTGKNAAEVISHEVGHTLHLGHDGRQPAGGTREEYYGGGGSPFDVSWAPIMGVGYYANLSQWSKGEYTNPTNTEDDLLKIVSNNNDVDYRQDDYGATLGTAGYLEILATNTVSNEGIIETGTDVDAFRFATAGGAVTLNVAAAAQGPNLDILAELYNAANVLVASNNPDTQVGASVTATLAAGEYTLRVSGVGRGNPTTDGNYSDYASLGSYLLSGTVVGGVKPDRFTIQENRPNGTAVGTVVPRNDHAGAPLAYVINSGNTNNAFSINVTTGAITVSNASELNFETLSSRWDDAATFALFVGITNPTNPTLNETVRVVVSVTDLNEPPVITGGGSVTMLERTRAGTRISRVSATDPDRFDFATFSIVAGNANGTFAIDPATGDITVARELLASEQSTYTLTVQARDQKTPALTATTTVSITLISIPDGYSPGVIVRTYFENITGEVVSALTANAKFPNNPDSEEFLSSFDGDGHGDNFGSTIRGYIIPPTSGSYRFWIASDDSSSLRLSSTASPSGAVDIASVSGFTDRYQWTKAASQQSALVTLTAGRPYYIEARHKEGGGGDHLAVAWEGPGGITRQVIPGTYLAPFYQNYAPKITAEAFRVRENAFRGATVGVVQVSDVNAQDQHGSFVITGGTGASVFGIDSGTGRIFVGNNAVLNATTTPSYTLTVRTADSGSPALTGSATITINVVAGGTIQATGITQQIWTNISGGTIASLTGNSRYPNSPDVTRVHSLFDTGGDYAENYGSRIRAYVVPPTTGAYTFYLASDDEGQLRMSTSDNPAAATQIASVPSHAGRDEWTKYPSQTSTARTLTAGQRYYIEALHKEGAVTDFVRVAWTGPGITQITTVPGSALQPFDINVAPVWSGAPFTFNTVDGVPNGTRVGTVTATDGPGEKLTYSIVSGNGTGAFAIDPQTGVITVANRNALLRGQTMSITVAAQDDGAGVYPLKSSNATVAVIVRALPSGSYEQAVVSKNPVAYWRLSETSGTAARDYYSRFNGTHTGGVTVAQIGPRPIQFPRFEDNNYAPRYSGTTAFTSIPALNLNRNSVTFTAWIRRVGNAASFAGLVHSRAGNTVAGLHFGQANELRYIWNNNASTYNWNSGLIPPDNQWTFVALVVEPTKAIIYMNGGSGLVSAVNTLPHGIEEFDGTLCIAQDTLGSRFFNGLVDEVAVFDRALSPAEIGNLDFLPTVTLEAPDNSAAETAVATGEYRVTRTGPTTSQLVIGYITGGAATLGTDYSLAPGGSSVTIPAGQVSATISLLPVDDSLAEGSELAVTSLAAGDYVIGSPSSAAIEIADNDQSPMEQWRREKFGTNSADPAIAGDTADPDRDGLSNLLEYALGLNPLSAGMGGITSELITVDGKRYLRLTAAKNPNASDVVFAGEVTSGMGSTATWTESGTIVEVNSSTTLQVRDSVPVDEGTQRYIRLKVTHP